MPAACDFKFAAEHDGCPAGMVRGASGAPGLLRDAAGAPCVPFRRPRAAAEPASLRVFHIAKTATTSLVKELKQCVPARVRTDEGCWSGVNRETWTANLTAPSATSVLLRLPNAGTLLHQGALPIGMRTELANTLKLEAPAPPKPRQAPAKPDTPPANEQAETVADEEPKS